MSIDPSMNTLRKSLVLLPLKVHTMNSNICERLNFMMMHQCSLTSFCSLERAWIQVPGPYSLLAIELLPRVHVVVGGMVDQKDTLIAIFFLLHLAAAPSVPVSSQHANSSHSQTGLEQLPSPRPPRKSIFSMRPGRDFPVGPARREPHKLRQQQQKAQLKVPAQHELAAKQEVSIPELENVEPQKQARGLWEDTLIAATGAGNADSEDDPDKCKSQ